MTTLMDRLAEAQRACKAAASMGYSQYQQAKAALAAVQAEVDATTMRDVCVVGNTYPHRLALTSLGLRWDAGAHAWVGRLPESASLPSGCRVVTVAVAALESMDHAGSRY